MNTHIINIRKIIRAAFPNHLSSTEMNIIENEFTKGITDICVLNDSNVLVGHLNGKISLWEYSGQGRLQYIRQYGNESAEIRKIVPSLMGTFLSINKNGVITIWETDSGICKMSFEGTEISNPQAVVLPNNLLVVSGCYSCFKVWDLESKINIYVDNERCYRITQLRKTAHGLLLMAANCSVSIWKISRKECKLLNKTEIDNFYSMAILPTGELAIASGSLEPYKKYIRFYKISFDGGIYLYRTMWNRNVIDTIHPVAGYYILFVDRCRYESGRIELRNYIEDDGKELGDSIAGDETSRNHVILERKGAVLSICPNKIVIHDFSNKYCFHFPKHLAEVRKNARVLSQAQRSDSCLFRKLPKEVILKIISFTSDSKNEYENAVKEDVIQNYFCRPMISED